MYKPKVKNPNCLRNSTPTLYIQTLWLLLCKLFKPTYPCP